MKFWPYCIRPSIGAEVQSQTFQMEKYDIKGFVQVSYLKLMAKN